MSRESKTAMLVVLYASTFVSAFNENLVNVALVDVMAELDVSSITAQWLVTGYMAVTALIVALTAFLVQRFRIRVLFVSASLFSCACSRSISPCFCSRACFKRWARECSFR